MVSRLVLRGRSSFEDDEAVRPAIERQLEIIGESAGALSAETREEISAVNWSELRRLPIVLAHHYHRVDPSQVWVMATEDVAALLAPPRCTARRVELAGHQKAVPRGGSAGSDER